MRIRRIAWACLAAIVLAAPTSPAGEGGWTGTITEQVEFGWTKNHSLAKEVRRGPIGGGIDNEIVEHSTSRDLDGERKLEITVTDDQAVASVIGKGDWYTTSDIRRSGFRGACDEFTYKYESINLAVTASREKSQFSVAIDASGQYRISSSGSEKVWWDGYRGDRLIRMCEGQPAVWEDACKTAPPAWNQDCGAPETQLQFAKRTTAQFWMRPWQFEAAGTTDDPDHLSGSRTTSDWQMVDPSALPPWFTETMTKAGVLDRFGNHPDDVSFAMRGSISWDLRRQSSEGWRGTVTYSNTTTSKQPEHNVGSPGQTHVRQDESSSSYQVEITITGGKPTTGFAQLQSTAIVNTASHESRRDYQSNRETCGCCKPNLFENTFTKTLDSSGTAKQELRGNISVNDNGSYRIEFHALSDVVEQGTETAVSISTGICFPENGKSYDYNLSKPITPKRKFDEYRGGGGSWTGWDISGRLDSNDPDNLHGTWTKKERHLPNDTTGAYNDEETIITWRIQRPPSPKK